MKRANIAALAAVVAIGTTAVSCKKEQTKRYGKAKITSVQTKDTGDDDEDPVIRGKVKKNNSPVSNAFVETMSYGDNLRVGSLYTDSLGDFQEHVTAGTYYFKVTAPGATEPKATDTVHVSSDTYIEISLD